jgi:hypothetical protein
MLSDVRSKTSTLARAIYGVPVETTEQSCGEYFDLKQVPLKYYLEADKYEIFVHSIRLKSGKEKEACARCVGYGFRDICVSTYESGFLDVCATVRQKFSDEYHAHLRYCISVLG